MYAYMDGMGWGMQRQLPPSFATKGNIRREYFGILFTNHQATGGNANTFREHLAGTVNGNWGRGRWKKMPV